MTMDRVRVAGVQHGMRAVASFEEFAAQCAHHAAAAGEWNADIVVFPEFLTTQLMSIPRADGRPAGIGDLAGHTDAYRALFGGLAVKHRQTIVAGTHVHVRGDRLYNGAHVFFPDGRVVVQDKLHLTPTEVSPWAIAPGEKLEILDFPWGKAAVLICYDVEFPELARQARARGADLLLVPSCTDDRQGFHRVRHCCHARAIEDQIYVVTTHTVGNLPVEWMRGNVGNAAIITPCDVQFAPGGVQAQGELNVEQIVVAELDLALLRRAREGGSVRTWQDRRADLYPLAT
jgi:predicted amidohydrolase